MLGCAEPDWSKRPFNVTSNLMEITFDVDERLKSESKRVMSYLKQVIRMIVSLIFFVIFLTSRTTITMSSFHQHHSKDMV